MARATALGAQCVIEAGTESTQADLGQFDVAVDAVGASGGHVEVAIAATFPLSAGRAAFESERRPGRAEGKTVLVVGDRK